MSGYKCVKWFTQVFVLLLSCVGLSISHAGVQSSPTTLLTYIADNMVTQLRNNKATLKPNPVLFITSHINMLCRMQTYRKCRNASCRPRYGIAQQRLNARNFRLNSPVWSFALMLQLLPLIRIRK